MNQHPRISAVPDDALFKQATVSVVQIGPDHIPDFDPGGAPDAATLLDRGLVRLQRAMLGKARRGLDDVSEWLNWPPGRSRREIGLSSRIGEPSDISIAAVLLSRESPFGIQYEWAPGAIRFWPDGFCLVLWRGELFERDGDLLTKWTGGDE